MKLSTRLLYGDPNKADLKPEKTDDGGWKSRSFFGLLFADFWNIIKVNLLLILFLLPLALWITFNNVVMSNALASDYDTTGYIGIFILGLIILLLAEAPVFAGGANVLRKYAADEHSFIWSDFKEGLKNNWKQMLGLTAIAELIAAVAIYLGVVFWNYSALGVTPALLGVGACLVVLIILVMVITVAVPLMCTFKLPLKHVIKDSLLLVMAKLPMNFLIIGLSVLIGIFCYRPNTFLQVEETTAIIAFFIENLSLLPYAVPFLFLGLSVPMFIQAYRSRYLMKKFMGLEAAEVKAAESFSRYYDRKAAEAAEAEEKQKQEQPLSEEDWITDDEQLNAEIDKKNRRRRKSDATL